METLSIDPKTVKESNRQTMVSRIEYMKMVDLNNSLKKDNDTLKKTIEAYKNMLIRVTQTKITGTSMASVVIRNLIKQIKTLLEK